MTTFKRLFFIGIFLIGSNNVGGLYAQDFGGCDYYYPYTCDYDKPVNLAAKILRIESQGDVSRARVEVTRIYDGWGKSVGNVFVIQFPRLSDYQFGVEDIVGIRLYESTHVRDSYLDYYQINSYDLWLEAAAPKPVVREKARRKK